MASIAKCMNAFKKNVTPEEFELLFHKAALYQEAPHKFTDIESKRAAIYDIIDDLEKQLEGIKS